MLSLKIISQLWIIVDKRIINGTNNLNFPHHFTYYLVIERIHCSIYSLQTLLLDNAIHKNHAIGLIARNLLTDFLSIGYLTLTSKTSEELFMKLYALHNDCLMRVDKTFNKFFNHGVLSDKDLNEYNNRYREGTLYYQIRSYCEKYKPKPFPS
ncbi:MAG: hypothetical protein ACR2GN_08975, partial [Bacteroidia bacterium]